MKEKHPSLILLVLAAAFVVVGSVGPPARAVDVGGQGFQSMSLSASAGALQISADGLAGQPTGSAAASIPLASAQLTRSSSNALASLAWPGALAANVGSLLYLLGPNPCLPGDDPVRHQPIPVVGGTCDEAVPIPQQVLDNDHYLNTPLRAEAQNPASPHADQSVPGGRMSADASTDVASAAAHLGGGFTSSGLSFATIMTSSEVHATGATSAASQTVSKVQDLSVADGVFTIASVSSAASATTSGTMSTASGGTVLSGMAVNGSPITVDGSGVHAAGHDANAAQATDTVMSALASAGIRLYTTSATRQVRGGIAEYRAGSLVIVWDVDNSGRNHDVILVLGGADARAAATLPYSYGMLPGGMGAGLSPGGSLSGAAPGDMPTGAQLPATSRDELSPMTAQPSVDHATPTTLRLLPVGSAASLGMGWVLLFLAAAAGLACLGGRLPDRFLTGTTARECVEGVTSRDD